MNRGLYLVFIGLIFIGWYFAINLNNDYVSGVINEPLEQVVYEERVKNLSNATIYPLVSYYEDEYSFSAVRLKENFKPTDFDIDLLLKTIKKVSFPKNLVSNTVFVFASESDLSRKIFLKDGGNVFSFNINNEDYAGRRGLYFRATGDKPIIVIGSQNSDSQSFTNVFLHELGHRLADELTPKEWNEYYSLRLIPDGTPRYKEEWDLSPNEDFAEIYKYLSLKKFIEEDVSENIKTRYGNLHPIGEELICASLKEDSRIQDCRRYVVAHPEQYPSEKYRYFDLNESLLISFFEKILKRL